MMPGRETGGEAGGETGAPAAAGQALLVGGQAALGAVALPRRRPGRCLPLPQLPVHRLHVPHLRRAGGTLNCHQPICCTGGTAVQDIDSAAVSQCIDTARQAKQCSSVAAQECRHRMPSDNPCLQGTGFGTSRLLHAGCCLHGQPVLQRLGRGCCTTSCW